MSRAWRYRARALAPGRGRRQVTLPSKNKKRIQRLEQGKVGQEKKLHDVLPTSAFNNAGIVSHLTGIAQGDSSQNRDGLRIKIHSLQGKITLTSNDANPTWEGVRIILFIDKHCQELNPAVGDVLETANWVAFREHEGFTRFKIFYDKTWVLRNQQVGWNAQTVQTETVRYIDYFKKWKRPLNIAYSGTAAPVANAITNNIFMLAISSDAANNGTYACNFRFRFTG